MKVAACRHTCTHSALWSGITLAYHDRNLGQQEARLSPTRTGRALAWLLCIDVWCNYSVNILNFCHHYYLHLDSHSERRRTCVSCSLHQTKCLWAHIVHLVLPRYQQSRSCYTEFPSQPIWQAVRVDVAFCIVKTS